VWDILVLEWIMSLVLIAQLLNYRLEDKSGVLADVVGFDPDEDALTFNFDEFEETIE
jgi:hypothetical protein